MPIRGLDAPAFRAPREIVVKWDTWRQGLNTLLRENEINGAEMVRSQNLMLVGSGVPTKRWGSRNYFLAGPGGNGKFALRIKDRDDNTGLLAFTDWGYLTKKDGASYTLLAGASWPTGSNLSGVQLGNAIYLFSQEREMVRYDFNEIIPFNPLSVPGGLTATNISGVSGINIVAWRVSALGPTGGETLASPPAIIQNVPQVLNESLYLISWDAISAASGDLTGYNIYRGRPGDESWVGNVGSTSTVFLDPGEESTDPFRTAPLADTSEGPKAKFAIRYQDRMIIAGIPGDPTRVMISGRWPFHQRFDWYSGGGAIMIEPDSGENITGLGIHQEKVVLFKENSVWELRLNQVQFGQYLILDPQYKLLTASQGCKSHKSIAAMENDVIFANEQGVYILRYEPQLQNIINANEISAKIRPFFESLSEDDHRDAAGGYVNKKYVLSYPHSKQTIIFDRERLCFYGPWRTPFGINQWLKYLDDQGKEHWLAIDSDDSFVTEFSPLIRSDKGVEIRTVFRSKREEMGDWTLYKTINELYANFRAVSGSVLVSIYIEDRAGKVVTTRAFTLESAGTSGVAGIGSDGFGDFLFGDSEHTSEPQGDEIQKKAFIYKSARTYQVEIKTSGVSDNYELLGITTVSTGQARGNSPSRWNVV